MNKLRERENEFTPPKLIEQKIGEILAQIAPEKVLSIEEIKKLLPILHMLQNPAYGAGDFDTVLTLLGLPKNLIDTASTPERREYSQCIKEYCENCFLRNVGFIWKNRQKLTSDEITQLTGLILRMTPGVLRDECELEPEKDMDQPSGEILAGSEPGTFSMPRVAETPHGITIVAGCDQGYAVTENQDRTVLIPEYKKPADGLLAAVIDGMGGIPDGDKAAHLLGETIRRKPPDRRGIIDFHEILRESRCKMEADSQLNQDAGACFLAAHIKPDEIEKNIFRLKTEQMGDCRIIVLDEHGIMVATSCDQGGSEMQWLQRKSIPKSIRDAANDRNKHIIVFNVFKRDPRLRPLSNIFLRGQEFYNQEQAFVPTRIEDPQTIKEGLRLGPGWRVILCSDGLEIFTRAEIATAVRGLNAEQAFRRIKELMDIRLQKESAYLLEDCLLTSGIKKDHRSLVIVDIPGHSKTPAHPVATNTSDLTSISNDIGKKSIPSLTYYRQLKHELTTEMALYETLFQKLNRVFIQGNLDFEYLAGLIPDDHNLPQLYRHAFETQDVRAMLIILSIAKEHARETMVALERWQFWERVQKIFSPRNWFKRLRGK